MIPATVPPESRTDRQAPSSDLFQMPSPGSRRSLMIAACALFLGILLIPFVEIVSLPVRSFFRTFPKGVFASMTQLPSPTMLLTMAAIIWILDIPRRAALAYLVVTLAVCGLVTEPVKQLLGRARPETSILMTEHLASRMERLSARYSSLAPPAHTPGRDRWLLLHHDRPWFEDAFASFPSGHALSVFAVAAFLCALYPRGRWLWILLAAGCAFARIRARRHFLDEVIFSAGMGWLLASWVFSWGWPARLARRLGLDSSTRHPELSHASSTPSSQSRE